MIGFIKKPNLPDGKVNTVICGTDDENILSYFKGMNIRVIKNAPNLLVDSSVSFHADMSAIHLGSEFIVVDKNQGKMHSELIGLGMSVIKSRKTVAGEYPDDIGLNFAIADNRIFGKFVHCDESVLKYTDGYDKVNVRQGYCKCSVLVVDNNAIITDDEGIYRKASEKDMDALLISKGDIHLNGHSYGFIGGASGKISRDTVLFFGDIKKHRDFEKISSFLLKHGCRYECTDGGEIKDIGGIIPITEEV